MASPKAIVWLREPLARELVRCLPSPHVVVSSVREFARVQDRSAITFVDEVSLREPAVESSPGPIVAICEDSLKTAVGWLQAYPTLHHVISASTLSTAMAKEHFSNVTGTLPSTRSLNLKSWLGPDVRGRRVQLTQASKREQRLDRMNEFFVAYSIPSRARDVLRDVADELVSNAFYDAPVAAGAVATPISRTVDVVLPLEHGVELAYGCTSELAIVRMRDPFGSLSRRRLIEVLARCAKPNGGVSVDTSMGGAGLGLWRVFSNAAFVAISVAKGRHTEFLVGIPKQPQRKLRPYAVHLFFHHGTRHSHRTWDNTDEHSVVTITTT